MKTLRPIFLAIGFLAMSLAPQLALAKLADGYFYRNRASWVKLDKLSKKQIAGVTLEHPVTGISTEQMAAMLLSIKMNKAQLLKKDVKELNVFNLEEANKYAPYIVQALAQAEPNQVVNVSLVQKRPYFIMRSDFLTVINLFKTSDGLHVYFNKLYAQLEGDYLASSKLDQSLSKAKSLKVSLQAGPGQTKTNRDAEEIVLNPEFDFGAGQAVTAIAVNKSSGKKPAVESVETSDNTVPATSSDIKSRLKKLDELKKDGLITNAEYQKKRTEILSSL